jgi:large subunit ribosomal protein L19
MQLLKKITKKHLKQVPKFKPGATVRVHQRIKEGDKERIQIFEGLVIAINSGNSTDKTFTVRKIVGGIGVEKIFPLYSTNITKIQVTKSSDVRRSKLYYMRKRAGKSARLKEKHLTERDVVMEEHEVEEETEEKQEKPPEPAVEEKAEEKAEQTVKEPQKEEKPETEVEEKAEETPQETKKAEKPEEEQSEEKKEG